MNSITTFMMKLKNFLTVGKVQVGLLYCVAYTSHSRIHKHIQCKNAKRSFDSYNKCSFTITVPYTQTNSLNHSLIHTQTNKRDLLTKLAVRFHTMWSKFYSFIATTVINRRNYIYLFCICVYMRRHFCNVSNT